MLHNQEISDKRGPVSITNYYGRPKSKDLREAKQSPGKDGLFFASWNSDQVTRNTGITGQMAAAMYKKERRRAR
jgi:hypothetical protein